MARSRRDNRDDDDDDDMPRVRRKKNTSSELTTILIVLGCVFATFILLFTVSTVVRLIADRRPAPRPPAPSALVTSEPTLIKPEPQTQPTPSDESSKPYWAPPTAIVKIGGVQVRLVETAIGKISLEDIVRKDAKSKDALLAIKLEITNTSTTKKITYRTWQGADFSFDRDFATLHDNYGNSYKRITFGFGSTPVGALGKSESLYPNKAVSDLLVYEIPLDTALFLDLELPAKNFGEEGTVRYRIPLDSISRNN